MKQLCNYILIAGFLLTVMLIASCTNPASTKNDHAVIPETLTLDQSRLFLSMKLSPENYKTDISGKDRKLYPSRLVAYLYNNRIINDNSGFVVFTTKEKHFSEDDWPADGEAAFAHTMWNDIEGLGTGSENLDLRIINNGFTDFSKNKSTNPNSKGLQSTIYMPVSDYNLVQ